MLQWVSLLVLIVPLAETVYLTEPAVFFHEKSAFELVPSGSAKDIDFGHSISYQRGKNASLLVGAPLFDLTGRVFECSIDGNIKSCTELHIDLDEMNVIYNRSLSPDQHFYLGASIAATEGLFLTCAPLRTHYKKHIVDGEETDFFGAFGTCFYYNKTDSGQGFKQYQGFGLERDIFLNKTTLKGDIYGGLGWSTLIDEMHDRIIIAEAFGYGSLVYGNISNPGGDFTNTYRSKYNSYKKSVKSQAMTMGNYFNDNNTYYACGVRDINTTGAVVFFSSEMKYYRTLKTGQWSVGSMFGEALCSADITRDGHAELVVGAPAHFSKTTEYDRGAIHIYTKTEPSAKQEIDLRLTILAEEDGARFGTTLTTNDVDRDSYPEIIVGAPYENSGVGALYILCGFELHEEMRLEPGSEIALSTLKRTQRIENKSLKSFGFSLQPIPDMNDNGSDGDDDILQCSILSQLRTTIRITIREPGRVGYSIIRDYAVRTIRMELHLELSVGAPDNSTVVVYKGIRAVTVDVTSRFPQNIEKPKSDHEYIYSSCVAVDLPPQPNNITTELLVKNTLLGDAASIVGQEDATPVSYKIKLGADEGVRTKDGKTEYCQNYTMIIPSVGNVKSEVSLAKNISIIQEFSETWVSLSAQSNLKRSVPFQPCQCEAGVCSPSLIVEFQWSGKSITNYDVGLSRLETVSVVVRNTGSRGCNSCAVLRVSGARVDTLQCRDQSAAGEYECVLTSPFEPNVNQTIDVILKMDEITTQHKKLLIDVAVYKTCDKSQEVPRTPFTVDYDFNVDSVLLHGSSTNRTISDTELLADDEEIISDDQTYIITNVRSVSWYNVLGYVTAINKPYIKNFTIKQPEDCSESNDTENFTANCSLTLSPFSTIKLILTATYDKKEISRYFKDRQITIETELVLQLLPDKTKHKTLTTVVTLEKEQSFGHNKMLVISIAVVVALLVLLIIIIILYKLNFFKRKAKEDLQELKQEIRRRSMRHSTRSSSIPNQHRASRANSNMDDIVIVDEPLDSSATPLSALDLENIRAHEANINSLRAQAKID